MHSLTIFTPTYNRAEYLQKCYRSLVRQKNSDFIWQIIDDGSTDGTKELVEQFIKQNKVAIEYYWKKNGGKSSAINYSLDITFSPLWVCLDSDDYLLDGAIDKILQVCDDIFDDPHVCGAFAVRSNKSGFPMKGKDVPKNVIYANQLDLRYKHKVEPEYVQIYKFDVIKKYRFPTFLGEKFVTESWLQDQLDQQYVFKVFHEPIIVCEYLPGGLTYNYFRLIRNNPLGFLEFYGQRTEICKLLKPKITAAIMYNAVYETIADKKIPKRKNWVIKLTTVAGKLMKIKLKNED